MSKISQLYAELSEQAAELGFESIGEAEQAGYGVDWQNAKLIKVEDEQEKAHEAWLEEKQQVLNDLDIVAHSDAVPFEHKEIVKQAIEFIRKGEM